MTFILSSCIREPIYNSRGEIIGHRTYFGQRKSQPSKHPSTYLTAPQGNSKGYAHSSAQVQPQIQSEEVFYPSPISSNQQTYDICGGQKSTKIIMLRVDYETCWRQIHSSRLYAIAVKIKKMVRHALTYLLYQDFVRFASLTGGTDGRFRLIWSFTKYRIEDSVSSFPDKLPYVLENKKNLKRVLPRILPGFIQDFCSTEFQCSFPAKGEGYVEVLLLHPKFEDANMEFTFRQIQGSWKITHLSIDDHWIEDGC